MSFRLSCLAVLLGVSSTVFAFDDDEAFIQECWDGLPDSDSVYVLLNLDANPAVLDTLIEEFPSIALLLMSLDEDILEPDEDGTVSAWQADTNCFHGFSNRIPSTASVRLLQEHGFRESRELEEATMELTRPTPDGTSLMARTALNLDGEPELVLRSSLLRWIIPEDTSGRVPPGVEVVESVAEVRLRLRLVKKGAFPAGRDGEQSGDLYEIVEILSTVPARRPDTA